MSSSRGGRQRPQDVIDGLLNSADFIDSNAPPGNDLATQTHTVASRAQGTSSAF